MGFSEASRGLVAAATVSIGLLACSSDWDLLDPRLGGNASAGGVGASGGDTGSGGIASSGGSAGDTTAGGSASGGAASGGTGGFGGASGGAGGTGGLAPGTLTVVASVAECVYEVAPDPDVCEAATGLGNMTADASVNAAGDIAHGFVRFDVDGTLAGRTVTSVLLRLTVSDAMGADSVQSGDVWEVAPFTRQDLFNAVPAQVGAAPLALSVGPVVQNQLVEHTLPIDSVAANAPTALGIFNPTTNGVDYWNLNGAVPPELVIDYQ